MQQVYATNDSQIVSIVKTRECFSYAIYDSYYEAITLQPNRTYQTIEGAKKAVESEYGAGSWVNFEPKVKTTTEYKLNIS